MGDIISGVVGGIASVFGASEQESAAEEQARAARESVDLQRQMFDRTRADLAPYREAGSKALAKYRAAVTGMPVHQAVMSTNPKYLELQKQLAQAQQMPDLKTLPSAPGTIEMRVVNKEKKKRIQQLQEQLRNTSREIQTGTREIAAPPTSQEIMQSDPSYQFRLQQGLGAIAGSAATKGLLKSGATLKGLQQYGQNIASKQYQNYLNRLQGLAGTGQQAAAQIGSAGQNFASGAGQGIERAAMQTAGGMLGSQQTYGQGLQQLASGVGSFMAGKPPQANRTQNLTNMYFGG